MFIKSVHFNVVLPCLLVYSHAHLIDGKVSEGLLTISIRLRKFIAFSQIMLNASAARGVRTVNKRELDGFLLSHKLGKLKLSLRFPLIIPSWPGPVYNELGRVTLAIGDTNIDPWTQKSVVWGLGESEAYLKSVCHVGQVFGEKGFITRLYSSDFRC